MKVIPFSNGTEAEYWMANNCDDCNTKCHFKRNMELGFISGDITLKCAEFIGYEINKPFSQIKQDDYVNLFNLCQNKNKYKKKRIRFKISTDPKLF